MGYDILENKIIFPSAPVLGVNNDQSLSTGGTISPNEKKNIFLLPKYNSFKP